MIGWIVVITKGGHEAKVRAEIAAKGYSPYLPLCEDKFYSPRWKQYVTRSSPLFPCYVFVAWDGGGDWGWFKNARGALEVMREPGSEMTRPALIAPAVMEVVRATEREHGGRVKLADAPPIYAPGTEIVVTHGVLIGQWALVQRDEGARVRALFGTMTMVIPKMTVARAADVSGAA